MIDALDLDLFSGPNDITILKYDSIIRGAHCGVHLAGNVLPRMLHGAPTLSRLARITPQAKKRRARLTAIVNDAKCGYCRGKPISKLRTRALSFPHGRVD